MKVFLLGLIAAYRLVFSGLKAAPSCRFLPTCSDYAAEALERHGALAGSWLAAKRICHCHPFGGHGVDPVPKPISFASISQKGRS